METFTDIKVKVIPRSSRNGFAGKEGGVYRIKIASAPVNGLANMALIDFLAGKLRIKKADVGIVSGRNSRLKLLRIHGLSQQEVSSLLEENGRDH